MMANIAVAACSAAAGSIAMAILSSALVNVHRGTVPFETLGFMVIYAFVNVALIVILDSFVERGSSTAELLKGMGIGLGSLAAYAILGLAIGTLQKGGLWMAIPLTLVPVWCLRTALSYRARMDEHYYETITALTLMLQRAHPYTQGHVERVGRTAEEVGRRLGLPRNRARLLREAAVLHDIGKIAVDEQILDKPAKLTSEEMEHVRLHAIFGSEILAPVEEFAPIIPWIRHHHERPDGTGYPDGLRDDQIPIESKIIAVIDAYDAMTGGESPADTRSYRTPLTKSGAIAELERCAGTQFDLAVVTAFKAVAEMGEL